VNRPDVETARGLQLSWRGNPAYPETPRMWSGLPDGRVWPVGNSSSVIGCQPPSPGSCGFSRAGRVNMSQTTFSIPIVAESDPEVKRFFPRLVFSVFPRSEDGAGADSTVAFFCKPLVTILDFGAQIDARQRMWLRIYPISAVLGCATLGLPHCAGATMRAQGLFTTSQSYIISA